MKKTLVVLLTLCLCLLGLTACPKPKPDYGELTVQNVTMLDGDTVPITYAFSKPDKAEEITYTFEGNDIAIENGIVTGLVGDTVTTVTATTQHHETTFTVTVGIQYGTLTIADVEVPFDGQTPILPVFSHENRAEEVTYTFEGNDIAIDDGVITGLVPDTTTIVTASTAHHSTTFRVKVNYLESLLTNPTGAESKFALATPNEGSKYVAFATVDVEQYRENGFTRLSSFAFNASDNSWYNIEMNEVGDVTLYGRFNGVEKYFIPLFNKNDEGIVVGGKIHYTIAIYRNGQATTLFVNGKAVCAFTEEEMKGYNTLGALEVTAAADRANAGEYKVRISQAYYDASEEICNTYAKKLEKIEYETVSLASETGAEQKAKFGPIGFVYDNFIFKASVAVSAYDPFLTRISAFAFNVSDNSWYNIEMNEAGDATLYGRFNGVEKYHIRLFNKNDEGRTVDGKICYSIAILKQGQATYFFFEDKLVCSFSAAELAGYPLLSSLEMTSSGDTWYDGGAYATEVTALVENGESEEYAKYAAKTALTFGAASLTNAEGHESKHAYGNLTMANTDYVFTTSVTVNSYVEAWTRTSAFAFNGSDNSWYNIEAGADGNFTLFAKFNGVEKYFIHLFNKNDEGIMVDGKICYTVAILKQGQATYFFVNDKLVCSFSAAELNGYGRLETLEVTACANRTPGAYDVAVGEANVSNSTTQTYATYLAKIA